MLVCLTVAVVLVGAAVHWPGLSGQALSLDDGAFLTENALVQEPGLESTCAFFTEVLEPSTVGGYYLPLSMTSLMVDHALGGRPEHLEPFHRTSLAIHLANAVLLILLLYLLFGEPWTAACLGLLFVVHPLTVEPTSWVGERKTLLATLFALVCLVSHVVAVRRGSRGYQVVAVVAYALSVLSKPTAITLPLLLVLLDVWPLGRLGKRAFAEKVPMFALGGLSAAVTLISHSRTADISVEGWRSPGQMLLMACRNVVFYLGKLVWPTDLTSLYHVPEPLSVGQSAVLAGVIVSVAVLAAILVSRSRVLAVGVAFYVVALAPTLGLVRYSWVLVSDKYLYFPVVGLLLLAGWWLSRVWTAGRGTGRRRLLRGALLLSVVGLASIEARETRRYLERWQTTLDLYQHMVELAPQSARAHDMLGKVLAELGRAEEAMAAYQRAVELDPSYASAWTNHGNLLFDRGEVDRAMQLWETALRLDPEFADAHANLAVGLASLGRGDEAVEHLLEAIRLDPRDPYSRNNLALQLFSRGRPDRAEEQLLEALRLKPSFADAHLNLGRVLAAGGRHEEALVELEEARRWRADEGQVERAMADTLLRAGRYDEAATWWSSVVDRSPRDSVARNNHATALVHLGRLEEAREQLDEAVRLDPTHVAAWMNLAFVLESRGEYEQAVRAHRQLVELQPDDPVAREKLERLEAWLGGL